MVTPRTKNFPRIVRIFKSRSNQRLIAEAATSLSREPEKILLVPGTVAGERFAHALRQGLLGLHRVSLIQWATLLSRQYMAAENLSPIGALGVEAISARALYRANLAGDLQYFKPVAALPGFATALARTIQELRLAGVRAEDLKNTGEAGGDLSRLLALYHEELEVAQLADLARILELAREAVESGGGGLPFVGLPMIVLDIPLESAAHRAFLRAVVEEVFRCGSGDWLGWGRAPVARSTKVFRRNSRGRDRRLDAPGERGTLARLRRGLFSTETTDNAAGDDQDGSFDIFSSPGESLEAVEIARRILKLAARGRRLRFDGRAAALRGTLSTLGGRSTAARADSRLFQSRDAASGHGRPCVSCAARMRLRKAFWLRASRSICRWHKFPDENAQATEWVAPQDEVLGDIEPRGDEYAILLRRHVRPRVGNAFWWMQP